MIEAAESGYFLFHGHRLVEIGSLPRLALKSREILREEPEANVLVFDESTGRTVDLDRRLTDEELLSSLETLHRQEPSIAMAGSDEKQELPRGRGRPRLGVVAREVTLLPRHWEWLASQPGGASVTLRKLVENAKRANVVRDRQRRAQEACYRFITTMAGDWPGFEEANRALFAGDPVKFERETEGWPADVRATALRLAQPSFGN